MMEYLMGMISMFGLNFTPRSWMACNGQLLAISSNTALFSLLGTTYGGDGRTTFALPDLRGRVPVGFGDGLGLQDYRLGEKGGAETTAITVNNMPSHNHTATAVSTAHAVNAAGSKASPNGEMLAVGANEYAAPDGGPIVNLAPEAITTTVTVNNNGGGIPFNNLQPFLAVNFCICVQGIFPSRN
jgi:microcystin-dependent protein